MRTANVKRLKDIEKAIKKKHPGKYETGKDLREPEKEPKKTVRKAVKPASRPTKVKVEVLNPTPKKQTTARPAAVKNMVKEPTKTVVKKTAVQTKLPKKEPVGTMLKKFVAQTKLSLKKEPEKKKEKSWFGWGKKWGKKVVAKTEDFVRKTDWRHLGNELWYKTKKFLYGTALASTVFLSNSSGAQNIKAFNKAPTDTNRKVGRQSEKPDNTIDMQTALNNIKAADTTDMALYKDPAALRNEILNNEIDKLVSNPEFLDDLARSKEFVDAISSNPEVLADFYMETGNNILKNFNFNGFKWTAEALEQIHDDGPIVEKLKKKMYITNYKNLDNRHCAAAVTAVLTSALGKDYHVSSAYQLAGRLAADPNFIVTDIKGDYTLLKHLGYSVFVNDRNEKDLKRVKHGHTGFIKKVEVKNSSKAKKNNGKETYKLVQDSGKNGPKAVPTSNRRNAFTRYGEKCSLCFDVYRSCEREFLLQMIKEDRAIGDVAKMAIEYGKSNPRELAKLVVEYTHLKKECGLDKIPQQVVTAENVQVVKDVQPTKIVDIQDIVAAESSESHDVIVAKSGAEYQKDSVEHLAFEKRQALKKRTAGRDTKKAVKNFAKGSPLKGKRLAAIVRKFRREDRV